MSDGKKNSDQSERPEPQPRNPRDDFKEQLKRIRNEAVGDLKKSLGMPKEDADRSKRDETSFSRSRPPGQSPSLSGGGEEEQMPARASDTAGPSAPGKGRVKVTGEPLIQHREKRQATGYKPESDVEQLLDAKDAGQYHTAATAGGGSESANGALGLDGIRKIYHSLGTQAREAGDPKGEVSAHYPRADPAQVEKDMVNQTAVGMRILKDAYKDGYTKKLFKTTADMLEEQQGQGKGTTARPSGIIGSLLNKLRGSSEPGFTSTAVAGVRGSQTAMPEAAYARKLLHDGHLRDEDIDTVLSLLDSTDRDAVERLKTIVAKYREEGIGTS